MAKSKRVQRPKGELRLELIEQLALLRHSCEAYDRGLEAIGKHIGLSLRVLLHQHGQSRSLLDQLGLRSGKFLDSAGPLNPRNLLTEHRFVGVHLTDAGATYVPLILLGASPFPLQPIPFVDWWNNPVIKDNASRLFCRRDLIQHVVNTDGGAHVDPDLDEAYMALSRQNSLGWVFNSGDVESALSGKPELACMRQIAHEVLATLNLFSPDFSEHAKPVIPARSQ